MKITSSSIVKKAFVILMGLLFALIVFEIGLRLIAIDSWSTSKSNPVKKSQTYTIMNLGNSYTYGSGAVEGMDYSTQLEKILNQTRSKSYKVINRGLRNINSSFIVESLPLWLKEDQPKMVFIMTGEPNYWNRYGFWNFLKTTNQENQASTIEKNDFLRNFKTFKLLELFLNREESWNQSNENYSNTFRGIEKNNLPETKYYLGYLWLGSLEEGANFDFRSLNDEQSEEAVTMLKYIWETEANPTAARLLSEYYLSKNKYPNEFNNYLEKAVNGKNQYCYTCLIDLNSPNTLQTFSKNEAAHKKFQEILKHLDELGKNLKFKKYKDFNNFINNSKLSMNERVLNLSEMNKLYPSSLNLLNRLFQEAVGKKQYGKLLLEAVKRSMDINPLGATADFAQKLIWIHHVHPELRKETEKMYSDFTLKFKKIDFKKIESINDKIEAWIISDLEKMITLAHQSGAKVVVQTYPPVKKAPPRLIDLTLRKWWKNRQDKSNIEFMDVGLMLKDKLELKNGGDDYYATQLGPFDNHLNGKGYGEISKLMAPFVPVY